MSEIIINRFLEMTVTIIVLSSVSVLLNTYVLPLNGIGTLLLLLVASLVFYIDNIRRCRWSYVKAGKYSMYLKINIATYILLVAVCAICSLVVPGVPYTWMLVITKLPKFILGFSSNLLSALMFHAVGILTVILAPAGVRIMVDNDPMPPKMENE